MSYQRCAPLAAWTSAWLVGQIGPDEVIDAVTGSDAPHLVAGLHGADDELRPLREVLVRWRRSGAPVRLVLPVAGDVRGVPGPQDFRAAALEAGEAVIGGCLAVVPSYIDYSPSSAPPTVLWQAFETEPAPPDDQQLADARYELTTAIREAATALLAADVAGWAEDISEALREARRASEFLNLPPSFPSPAIALLSQAERMQAVLDLAAADPVGGAVDRMGIAARSEALRPLDLAVRRAKLAGYNAAASRVG
jgi:hypothetical protein